MVASCSYTSYKSTGYFSKLILDYLQGSENRAAFLQTPTLQGVKDAIAARQEFNNNRTLLVSELQQQYEGVTLTTQQLSHIEQLNHSSTFTICTAHQPNIFTGHLYFIYKILHTIKLAQWLKSELPQYNFVPVYYMGSEDADLDELGHINLNGEKLIWQTKQTGAVGRMKVDKALIDVIGRMKGELSVLPFGNDIAAIFSEAYTLGTTIQQATLMVVQRLFSHYGLITIIPDNANLKRAFNPVVKRELLEAFSHVAGCKNK